MEDVKLPPMPEDWRGIFGYRLVKWEEAREYARQAVLAERERCAKVCDEIERLQDNDNGAANTGGAAQCAEAIRSGN